MRLPTLQLSTGGAYPILLIRIYCLYSGTQHDELTTHTLCCLFSPELNFSRCEVCIPLYFLRVRSIIFALWGSNVSQEEGCAGVNVINVD